VSDVDTEEDMKIDDSDSYEPSADEIRLMTWVQVKKLCKDKNMPIRSRTKDQLVERLLARLEKITAA
jgi:DNA repair photolyase